MRTIKCKSCGHVRFVEEKKEDCDIPGIVADHFGVSLDKMFSKDRHREITFARQVAMYLLRRKRRMTLKGVAAVFNRDHTTAIHSLQTVNDLMFTDPAIKNDVNLLLKKISMATM